MVAVGENQAEPQVAFPMKALMARIGTPRMDLWAQYLPPDLHAGDVQTHFSSAKPASGKIHPVHSGHKSTKCLLGPVDVAGRVWELSRHPEGSREVQHAIDTAQHGDAVAELISELQGRIWETSRCPHANHVLQKCIGLMKPKHLQFLVDELCVGNLPVQAARHKYGCRIVQKLLEHCDADQVQHFADAIVSQTSHVARHPFGNYVIQHLLSHANPQRSQALRRQLQKDICVLATDPFGCAVLSTAMSALPFGDRLELAKSLVRDPDVLASVTSSRHGSPAASAARGLFKGHGGKQAKTFSQNVSFVS